MGEEAASDSPEMAEEDEQEKVDSEVVSAFRV